MPPARNPNAKTILITLIVAGVAVLALVAGLVLRARGWLWSDFLLLGAGLVLALCAIALPFAWVTGRRMQRQLQEMMDAAWAHWTYGEAEWRTFSDAEFARDRKRAQRLPLQIVGTAVVVGAAFHFVQNSWTIGHGVLLLGGAFGVPVGLVVGLSTWLTARSTYRQRLVSPGNVFIGPHGVYQDGAYSTWNAFGLSLMGVTVEKSDPSVLQFRIAVRRAEDWLLRVAIPKGKEKEAAALAKRFGGAPD
jgi:hypothetical protein